MHNMQYYMLNMHNMHMESYMQNMQNMQTRFQYAEYALPTLLMPPPRFPAGECARACVRLSARVLAQGALHERVCGSAALRAQSG
jgi:hypothetical protein